VAEDPPAGQPLKRMAETSGRKFANRVSSMNRFPASLECSECERLRAAYEQTLARRLQAEADLLTAIHARNPVALETARATIYRVVLQWTRADGVLRRHQQSHALDAAA